MLCLLVVLAFFGPCKSSGVGDLLTLIRNAAYSYKDTTQVCKLLYLHIPKSASTFCLTLEHLCSPRAFETAFQSVDYADYTNHTVVRGSCVCSTDLEKICGGYGKECGNRRHQPLPKCEKDWEKESTSRLEVTIIRNPIDRLVSGFVDHTHHDGMDPKYYNNLQIKMTKAASVYYLRDPNIFALRAIAEFKVFAADPATFGCVTKMFNCYWCYDSDVKLNNNMVKVAIERLSEFFFVGNFGEYHRDYSCRRDRRYTSYRGGY